MTVIISGDDGVSDVDGSAGTPAIRGTDANTGIFFGSDIIGFSEGGTECARFNADAQFVAAAGTVSLPVITTTGDVNTGIFFPAADTIAFSEGGAEVMRVNSSGDLLIGTTGLPNITGAGSAFINDGESRWQLRQSHSTTDPRALQSYSNPNGGVGSIQTSGSSTSFNTSSDYRLKNTIAPMTGALAKVALLKPCTYKWNCDGSDGQGFIAHELAEVVPQCVSGEKDAVETYTDEEGVEQTRPVHQGVDTSFLVATLTAAIQELKAINDAQASRIETLEAKVAALEAN